jgi:hypothetical protein
VTTDVWLGIKDVDVSGRPLRRTLDVVRGTSTLSALSVVSVGLFVIVLACPKVVRLYRSYPRFRAVVKSSLFDTVLLAKPTRSTHRGWKILHTTSASDSK